MSYILEALKKAQAERARGAVPGVDAQPVPTLAAHAPARHWLWATGIMAAAAVALVLYWPASEPRQEERSPGPPPAMSSGGQPAAASAPPAAPSQPSAPSKQSTPSTPSTLPEPGASASAPATPAPAKPQRKLGEPVPAAVPSPVAAPERIALLQELPPQIQREIPPLAINGYIYASNPADRSVLINNRLRREGDQLAEGLTLEKLLPSEMVLNYRGYRYRISY